MEELDNYIAIWQNTVAQYIVTWTILDIFLESQKLLGEQVGKLLLDHRQLILKGARDSVEAGGAVEVGGWGGYEMDKRQKRDALEIITIGTESNSLFVSDMGK